MLPLARIIKLGNKQNKPTVLKIASSDTTVYALMSDGTLYSRGSQEFGQMGIGNIITQSKWIVSTTNVSDIWCGYETTLIKKIDNSMWYAGNGSPIGLTNTNSTVWASASVVFNRLTGKTIKQIAISAGALSVLCTDNTIWNTGYGSYGQLGNNRSTDSTGAFVQGTMPTGITPSSLVCHFLMHGFIGTDGRLYYTGAVPGVGTTDMTLYSKYTLCSQIPNTYAVKDYLSNASYFGFAIANNISTNKLYAYHGGGQYFGQLADGVTTSTYISLRQTSQPPGDIIRKSVGYSYFSNHIVTTSGVYATGNNSGDNAGQLGIGTQSDVSAYTKCILPTEMNMNNVYITSTTYRTYLTDGIHVYSAGQHILEGGIQSDSFIKDTPNT